MAPKEIWCNESQERYVLAVRAEDLPQFEKICHRERAPFAVVGEARAEEHLALNDSYFDNAPVDLPMDVVFGKPPKMHRDVKTETPTLTPVTANNLDFSDALNRVLQLPAVASKSFLITIGDRTVSGLVHRDQMVGPWQVPVADAAVTLNSYNGYSGEAMAMGERTPSALIESASAARMSVAEAITNIASTPVTALSDIVLSANWMAAAGEQGEDAALYQAVEAIGMDLCPALGISIPVGKDSLAMTTRWNEDGIDKKGVSPLSLIITAAAHVKDVRATVTPELNLQENSVEVLYVDLADGKSRLGGSALAQVYNQLGDETPDVESPKIIKDFFAITRELIADKKLLAYHDRSDGGLIVTLLEMAFASQCGLEISLPCASTDLFPTAFNEELGVCLQVPSGLSNEVAALFATKGINAFVVARNNNPTDKTVTVKTNDSTVLQSDLSVLHSAWHETSYQIQSLRDNADCCLLYTSDAADES